MKKRFLCLLTALCLTLILGPAAFAAEAEEPITIMAHGEEIPIPTWETIQADLAAMPMLLNELQPDANGVYHITSEADFASIPASVWIADKTFELDCDLDLTKLAAPAEWGGYIPYFKGTLNGNGHTISGFPNNTYFIYHMIGGNIKGMTLDLNGTNAGALVFMPAADDQTPIKTVLDSITVTGSVTLTSSDQSNYSPFIYCSGKGGLEMRNCTNEAVIDGNIYGSIFYGYCPLYTTANGTADTKYVFDSCTNTADVTLKYAAMFFGNPSGIEAALQSGNLVVEVTNCTNTGEIRGINSSHYFAPSLNSADLTGQMQTKEQAIQDANQGLAAGQLTVGERPENFTYTITSDKTIIINAPSNDSNIAYYVVSVGSYCQMYAPDQKLYGGTDRYAVTEKITASALQKKGTAALKYYGIADADYGSAGTSIRCTNKEGGRAIYTTRQNEGEVYYTLKPLDELADGKYQRYAYMENGHPMSGCQAPAFVDVTAFDKDDHVVGFAKEGTVQ